MARLIVDALKEASQDDVPVAGRMEEHKEKLRNDLDVIHEAGL